MEQSPPLSTPEQTDTKDLVGLITEKRDAAKANARIYTDSLKELFGVVEQLKRAHVVISGTPYAGENGPIYSGRERYAVTDQQALVWDAWVKNDRRDGDEQPTISLTVSFTDSRDLLTFEFHELTRCEIDEDPAERYYTGPGYTD